MSSATIPKSTGSPPVERVVERIRIDDADWQTYEKFLAAIGDRGIRCTYDRGRLEIKAPMRIREREKRFLGSAVERACMVLHRPFEPCGSMTIRREDLHRGFEPDECFYLDHALAMLKRGEPDFSVDPPPDLAIEVDITSSSIDRQALYASIGVPELWRFADDRIQFLVLVGGAYQPSEFSRAFPMISTADVNRYLAMIGSVSHLDILDQFESWLRQQVGTRPPTTTSTNGAGPSA
jgi:Uma2 family endonuclease